MNLSDINTPCEMERPKNTMELAGEMVGLDLTNPIDCSEMDVMHVHCMSSCDEGSIYPKLIFERETVLRAFVINEDGVQEELEITFRLKSQRMPKIKNRVSGEC